jgi:CBS domain-containing protein
MAVSVSRILNEKGWKVFTVEASAPLQSVIDMLAEHRVGVLVVTSGGQLAGIISERDVIGALSGNAAAAIGKTAADVMTRSLETCTPDESEGSLMERMNAKGVRHLPVLADGKLAGIVSMRDVVKLRIEKIDEMMRAIRQDADLLK